LPLSTDTDLPPKPVARISTTKVWRPTLWKHGLVLISLPLIVQIITVSALYLALTSIHENAIGLSRTRNIASEHAKFVANLSVGFLSSILYNVTQNERNRQRALLTRGDLTESVAKLNALVGVDGSASDKMQLRKILEDNLKLQNQVMSAAPDAEVDPWFGKQSSRTESIILLTDRPLMGAIKREQDLIAQRTLASEETQRLLNVVLPIAACLSGILSAGLALFMIRKLSKRINAVVENSVRLGALTPLEKPLDGDDELALVDQCLHDAGQKLAELEQARQQMVSVASHELRTPLSSLSALIDVTQAGIFGTLTEEGEDLAKKIKQTVVDLITMITNLLDLDRMQSGKQLVHKETCSPNDILGAVIANLSFLAQERQIEIHTEVSKLQIEVDPKMIVQALTCILREFVEELPAKSAIELSCQTTKHTTTLKISAPNLLAPGRNAHVARQRVSVDFSKSVAEQHGGQMQMRSTQPARILTISLPPAVSSEPYSHGPIDSELF
jgi:K+-sensing histidine kinase KdpD